MVDEDPGFRIAKDTMGEVKVPVDAYIAEKDLDITTVFHWRKTAKGWRVVDVSFDGASLVKDYQNQFGRIIRKEGTDAFLNRLQARLEKVQTEMQTS